MTNKKLSEFTLEDIVREKINYTQNSEFDEELVNVNSGEIKALEEILADINMEIPEFLKKYLKIAKILQKKFEERNAKIDNGEMEFRISEEIDFLSGYNNAIIEVLRDINPKYLFSLDEDLDVSK